MRRKCCGGVRSVVRSVVGSNNLVGNIFYLGQNRRVNGDGVESMAGTTGLGVWTVLDRLRV
jgi:hypothetical protein